MTANYLDSRVAVVHGCFSIKGDFVASFSGQSNMISQDVHVRAYAGGRATRDAIIFIVNFSKIC